MFGSLFPSIFKSQIQVAVVFVQLRSFPLDQDRAAMMSDLAGATCLQILGLHCFLISLKAGKLAGMRKKYVKPCKLTREMFSFQLFSWIFSYPTVILLG